MQQSMKMQQQRALPSMQAGKQAQLCSLPRLPVQPRQSVVAKAAPSSQEQQGPSMKQRLAGVAGASMLTFSALAGAGPSIASEFDLLAEPKPTNYFVDDANALSKSTRSDLDKKLKELEEKTGYRLEVLTLRKLEYETDAFAYTDKILRSWYPSKDELDTKGALLVMTAGKEGAISGGDSFINAVGEELLDSIVGDQIPIYTEQEKYNLTVESTVDRIAAKLEGKEVPDGPMREEGVRKRTFRTKEETEKSKNVTSTVVLSLLFIAVVVPMLQYYGYVAKD